MADKTMDHDEVVGRLRSGMTLGIGGWGSRRKPMSLVRAIACSDLEDLTIVSYAGPDLGLLCATGKVKKAVYGFASLDSIPLEPWFRRARQAGSIEVSEIDEGMLWWGLEAAAMRLPFLPIRAGLGSDVMTSNPDIKTVRSPYEDGEELVAMPALHLDAALIHVHRADAGGNGQILGPDPFFDDIFSMAATETFVSCERLVSTGELADEGCPHTLAISRAFVRGVVEAPMGAHFTECPPDYGRDESFQRAYATAAKDDAAWEAFAEEYVRAPDHATYVERVRSR